MGTIEPKSKPKVVQGLIWIACTQNMWSTTELTVLPGQVHHDSVNVGAAFPYITVMFKNPELHELSLLYNLQNTYLARIRCLDSVAKISVIASADLVMDF